MSPAPLPILLRGRGRDDWKESPKERIELGSLFGRGPLAAKESEWGDREGEKVEELVLVDGLLWTAQA